MIKMDSKELKTLRMRKEMTQQAIANVIGISQNTYRMKELGQALFTSNELMKLAEIFEVKIMVLDSGIFFTQ